MRRLLFALATLAAAGSISPAALAASPPADKARAQFVIFDPSVFDGTRVGPPEGPFEVHRGARFGRLNRLPLKSFLPALYQTAKAPAFK